MPSGGRCCTPPPTSAMSSFRPRPAKASTETKRGVASKAAGSLQRSFAPGAASSWAPTRAVVTGSPGFSNHYSLQLLSEGSGFSELDAIRIATLNGATALGIQQRTGSIAVGKEADLIVVRGDPLTREFATAAMSKWSSRTGSCSIPRCCSRKSRGGSAGSSTLVMVPGHASRRAPSSASAGGRSSRAMARCRAVAAKLAKADNHSDISPFSINGWPIISETVSDSWCAAISSGGLRITGQHQYAQGGITGAAARASRRSSSPLWSASSPAAGASHSCPESRRCRARRDG